MKRRPEEGKRRTEWTEWIFNVFLSIHGKEQSWWFTMGGRGFLMVVLQLTKVWDSNLRFTTIGILLPPINQGSSEWQQVEFLINAGYHPKELWLSFCTQLINSKLSICPQFPSSSFLVPVSSLHFSVPCSLVPFFQFPVSILRFPSSYLQFPISNLQFLVPCSPVP